MRHVTAAAILALTLAACSGGKSPAASQPLAPATSVTLTTATAAPTVAAATQTVAFSQPMTLMLDGKPKGRVTVDPPEHPPSFVDGVVVPTNGPTFTAYHVTLVNISDSPVSYNMFSWYVKKLDGSRYQPTSGREPALNSGTLAAGETVSGWITFDAGDQLTLVWAPALTAAPYAQWPG